MKEEIQMDMVKIAQKILTNPAFLDNSELLVKELQKLYERALVFNFLEKNHPEALKKNTYTPPSTPPPSTIKEEKIAPKQAQVNTPTNTWDDIRSQAPEKEIIFEEKTSSPKAQSEAPKTLNDHIASQHLQIGLNDRIAFVTHLFNGDIEAYNRAIAMINNLHTPDECWAFILQKVKPSFNNWQGKEEYEDRFFYIVSKRFG